MKFWSYFLFATAFFVVDNGRISGRILVNAQDGLEEATFQNCITWINLVDSNEDSVLSKSEYDVLVEVGLGGCFSTSVESIYWNFACPDCDNAINNEQCCPKDDEDGSVGVPVDESRFTFCAIVTTAIQNTCPLETTSPTNSPTTSSPTPVPTSSETDEPTSMETLEPTPGPTTLEPTQSPTPGPTTSQPSMEATTIVPSPTPTPSPTSTATSSQTEAESQSLVVAFHVQFYDDTDPATRNDNNDDIDNVMWELLHTAFDFLATESAILTTATLDVPTTVVNTTIDEWIPPTTCITTTAPDNSGNRKLQGTSSQFFCATGRLIVEVQFTPPPDEDASSNSSILTETVALEEFQSILLDFTANDYFTTQLEQLLSDDGYALEFVQFVPVSPPPPAGGEDDDVVTPTDKPTTPPTPKTNDEGEDGVQDEDGKDGNNTSAIIITVIVICVAIGLVAAVCCCFDRIECVGYQIECCFYDDNDSALEEDGATAAAEENGQKEEDKLMKDEQQGEGMGNGISSSAVDGGPSGTVGNQAPENTSSRTNKTTSSSNPTGSNGYDNKKELASTSSAAVDGNDEGDDDYSNKSDGGNDVHVFEDQEEEPQEQQISQTNDGYGETSSTSDEGTFDPRFNPYPLPAEARAIHPLPSNFPSLPYGYPGGALPAYAPTDPIHEDILSPEQQAAPSKSLSSSPSKKLVMSIITARHSHSGEDPAEQHQRQNMPQTPPTSSSASDRQQPGQASKEGGEQQQQYYDGVYNGSLDEEDKEKQPSQSSIVSERREQQRNHDVESSPAMSPIMESGNYDIDRHSGFLKTGTDLDSNPNLVHAV